MKASIKTKHQPNKPFKEVELSPVKYPPWSQTNQIIDTTLIELDNNKYYSTIDNLIFQFPEQEIEFNKLITIYEII